MLLIRILLLALLALPAAAHAEWRRAESPNFIVYSEGSEARLRERVIQLEDFHQLLRLMTGLREADSANKLHVYVVSGNADLQVAVPVGANVGGYYVASGEGIAAFVDSRATTDNHVLFHEYTHHFMMQYSPAAYAAWYVEGFAEYFSTARLSERYIDIGNFAPGRVYPLIGGSWLPIERVLRAGPEGLNRQAGSAYYSQAWLMTHYFLSNPDRQAMLRRYLAATASGTDPVAALQQATGLSAEDFTRDLRRYIGRGTISYRRLTRASARPVPPISVSVLPRSADDLMLYAAALRIGLRGDDPAAYLPRIRAAAARHPNDPLARRTLAHAELLYGDRAAALRLLEALQAEQPNDAELMYLRGRLHLEAAENGDDWEGESRQAQSWFTRAHRINPNHFQTLYRYAQSLRQGPQATSENTANVMRLAQQLAPQVVEIRMNAAALLIARNDIDTAEALLRPVMSDPHNESLATAARELIREARARGSEGAASPDSAR